MKAKVYRGDSFRAILDYCFLPKNKKKSGPPRGTIVGCNMAGATPRELSAEFGVARRLKPGIKKPVWHCSLSCTKGEKLTEEKWSEIAADYMQMMGFDPSMQYVAVRHQDTDYDHIHIIASRVGLNGKIFKGQWEAKEAIKATQALEKKHGLTITKGDDKPALKKQPKQSEIEKAIRTGQRPPKMVLQDMIDQVLATGPISAPDFVALLQAHSITARPNIATTGKFSGFSFSLDGDVNKAGQQIGYKGSSLGKAYTAAGLLGRGLTYSPDLHMPLLTGRHPQPAPDYSGEPKIRRKNGGLEFSLVIFMKFEPIPGGQLYRWQSGAPAFLDHGNEISCAGRATGAKVKGMLDLAWKKGWTRIELNGPREFQLAAALEAARRGISISGDNREIQEIWRQEHERTAAERNREPEPRNNRLSADKSAPAAGCGLRGLHELHLVPLGAGSELLLQNDARCNLGSHGEVIRDPELRREGVEYGSSIETGPSPTTATPPITAAGPDTAPAGSPTPPPGHQGPADSPAASPGEPAGDRTISTGDHRVEDGDGEFDQPGPDFGRPSPVGNHQGATGGTTDRQEGPGGRDPENRPRGVRGGLEALKNAPRRIVGRDHQSPAGEDHQSPAEAVTSEERPVRVDQESKPLLPLRYPSPGG